MDVHLLRQATKAFSYAPFERGSEKHDNSFRALGVLGAEQLPQARREAELTLEKARACPRCSSMLAHLFDRLGSTLFLDDDPEALAQSFDESERDGFAARVLAACIVLRGRERVALAF